MTDSDHHKPVPARASTMSVPGKPTPARELSGEPTSPPPEADVAETSVEVDGVVWTVRVTGRSGRASAVSPPLLLLGFSDGENEEVSLEALVVGGSLAALSEEQLETALSRARRPPDPDRKRTFFAEAGPPRRR